MGFLVRGGVRGGQITAIDVLADPDRIAHIDLTAVAG